jgi:hypothetical protein
VAHVHRFSAALSEDPQRGEVLGRGVGHDDRARPRPTIYAGRWSGSPGGRCRRSTAAPTKSTAKAWRCAYFTRRAMRAHRASNAPRLRAKRGFATARCRTACRGAACASRGRSGESQDGSSSPVRTFTSSGVVRVRRAHGASSTCAEAYARRKRAHGGVRSRRTSGARQERGPAQTALQPRVNRVCCCCDASTADLLMTRGRSPCSVGS